MTSQPEKQTIGIQAMNFDQLIEYNTIEYCIKIPVWSSTIIVTLHITERFVADYFSFSSPGYICSVER